MQETWYEATCDVCDTQNRVYVGDTNNPMGADPDFVQCYKCGHIIKTDEEATDDGISHIERGLVCPRDYENFLKLPITFMEDQRMGEWLRPIQRDGTVEELLDTWNIDDPSENSEMAQVLRHLRRVLNDG